MCARITFPEREGRPKPESFIIRQPNSVQIESSWRMLTDRATIILPRNVLYFNKNKVKDVFKKGDPVIIELGYNNIFNIEFTGYVNKVSADIPIIIECEDEMFKLKQLPVNFSSPGIKLVDLLKKIAPGYDIDALDVDLGSLRFPKTTVAKVLEALKQDYNLYSYFKGKQLVVGKIYQDDSDIPPVLLHLERNIVSNELNYKNTEDVLIRITAVSTLKSGDKIEVTVGDAQGEERQLSYYGITIRAELEKLANEDLRRYKLGGFDGSVSTFGQPKIDHGQKVRLVSDLYPERDGIYYVEGVKISFDDSPKYRRDLEIGEKVST